MKPLRAFVKELSHLKRISLMERGWGNGYVIIPEGHPMHGKHYDDIKVDVHGGLTFCGLVDMNGMIVTESFYGDKNVMHWDEVTKEDARGWIVGFDTAHYRDNHSRWPQHEVQKEADNLMHQLENMRDDRPSVSHDDQADAPVEGDYFDDNAPNGED